MINIVPKISEKYDQIGGMEEIIKKYRRAEIQFFPREDKPHEIDFSEAIEHYYELFNLKEVTVHPPLRDYDIEVVLMYDKNIIRKQLEQLVYLSKKLNIKINLIYHTHWAVNLHKANTVESIKELLKIIEGTQVQILVENLFMVAEPFNECSALELCKEINHSNLKMCLDNCHFHCQANMYREDYFEWVAKKLNREDCIKYIYQIHFSYVSNNDGYHDKKTHGIGHPNIELLKEDFKLLEIYGITDKLICTEIAEDDYSYRENQIRDIKWLESI